MKYLLIFLSCLAALQCNSQKNEDPRLFGQWEGTLKDAQTEKPIGKIVLEFTKDGRFVQYVGQGNSQNIIPSTYTAQNNTIISTDKANEKDESHYTIKNDTLIITYEGIENKYVKRK
jgi:hypothetical protein